MAHDSDARRFDRSNEFEGFRNISASLDTLGRLFCSSWVLQHRDTWYHVWRQFRRALYDGAHLWISIFVPKENIMLLCTAHNRSSTKIRLCQDIFNVPTGNFHGFWTVLSDSQTKLWINFPFNTKPGPSTVEKDASVEMIAPWIGLAYVSTIHELVPMFFFSANPRKRDLFGYL